MRLKIGILLGIFLLIIRAKLVKPASKLEPLINENDELISIFVSSIKTAKQKDKKTS